MSGILIIDKPQGWTSHDVVAFVKKRYGLKKVGHAGTLDPLATGVLVLLLNKATKLSERCRNQDKDYKGSLLLGMETDTGDAQGRVISTVEVPNLTEEQVKTVFKMFEGEQKQIPHPVSAVKYKGTRLYKLARRGIVVKPEARTIVIHKLKFLKLEGPRICFEVSCSKGTYIRTLAVDIGRKLGSAAHVESLRRTRSGLFNEEDYLTIEEIKGLAWEKVAARARRLMERLKIT